MSNDPATAFPCGHRSSSSRRFCSAFAILLASLAGGPADAADPDAVIAPFFAPPAAIAGETGSYSSLLKFYDGRPVENARGWEERRREILDRWHALMGAWPELLEQPGFEIVEESRRDNLIQQQVRVEVAPGQMVSGYLLMPEGAGPFPAVLVPFYEPETSAGLREIPFLDFGLQLARRGFVTLSIGSPSGDARKPLAGVAPCQPLSFLAYVAANCWTALAALPQVDQEQPPFPRPPVFATYFAEATKVKKASTGRPV